jgi:hypothetical protein
MYAAHAHAAAGVFKPLKLGLSPLGKGMYGGFPADRQARA